MSLYLNYVTHLEKFIIYRVFIVRVSKNEYINNTLQNHYMKLFCQHYKGVKFIEADSSNRQELCRKINVEIDSEDYKRCFINSKTKISKRTSDSQSQKFKKGTIPYLFMKQQMLSSSSLDVKENATPIVNVTRRRVVDAIKSDKNLVSENLVQSSKNNKIAPKTYPK